MKLVVNLKLEPTDAQAALLLATLERCNAACNWLSQTGWANNTLRQYDLHQLAYHRCRQAFSLAAQVTARCIAKVADAYKAGREVQRQFRPHAAQPYDERIFRIVSDTLLSIWTLSGREKIAYVCGERQRALLAHRKGEVDLMLVRGAWYIAVVCDVDEPDIIETTDILGVDLGIVNIATTSDGATFSGAAMERNRRRYAHRRRNLQRKGTRSARRKLCRIKGQQGRFQKDVNHCISKAIVTEAQRTGRGIAIEELGGIRGRVTARKPQRARLHNWPFHQLRQFLTYKSRLAGIPLIAVDPAYTSQTCPHCGTVDKRNRPTRDSFKCIGCGFAGPADAVAATNIRQRALAARAVVNQPMVAGTVAHAASSPSGKPSPSGDGS